MAEWRPKPEYRGKIVYIPKLYKEVLITDNADLLRQELGDLFDVFFERSPAPPADRNLVKGVKGKDLGKPSEDE
jgi:hypothetical protein